MDQQSLYKGRKGQKLLRELNGKIEAILKSGPDMYAESPEMDQILQSLTDPQDKLYFLERFQSLDRIWSGTLNYGLLRLCVKWIRIKKLQSMTRADVDVMLRDILPAERLDQMKEAAG